MSRHCNMQSPTFDLVDRQLCTPGRRYPFQQKSRSICQAGDSDRACTGWDQVCVVHIQYSSPMQRKAAFNTAAVCMPRSCERQALTSPGKRSNQYTTASSQHDPCAVQVQQDATNSSHVHLTLELASAERLLARDHSRSSLVQHGFANHHQEGQAEGKGDASADGVSSAQACSGPL